MKSETNNTDVMTKLPSNPKRRTFLKLLGIGGVAVAANLVASNVTELVNSAKTPLKVSKLGDKLSYTESSNETVIYDDKGEDVLIFDKS